MAQGNKKIKTKGKNRFFVTNYAQITKIHAKGRIPSYLCKECGGFWPQREDPTRVCIITGRNLIKGLEELTTRTADITIANVIWNSVISTEGAQYVCLDMLFFLIWRHFWRDMSIYRCLCYYFHLGPASNITCKRNLSMNLFIEKPAKLCLDYQTPLDWKKDDSGRM